MVAYHDVWQELCSYPNLKLAYKRARKHKTLKPYVVEFEADLANNLSLLRTELLFHFYKPKPLETFILRDPKTRKISKSDFRDRVVHHALCNVIEPLFEKRFIHDSYANRVGKGTLKAIGRFEHFQKKVTENFTRSAYVLKADVRHYFDEVDHLILLNILQKKINDRRIIWLVKRILGNYSTKTGKGMPLGNLTSQFFANVYLNELDQFVKQELKAPYYIRYVDDFVILHHSTVELEKSLQRIICFLRENLALRLHPTKSRIIPLRSGTEFLGFKIFLHHKLIKLKNKRSFHRTFQEKCEEYFCEGLSYDSLYDFMEGWIAYAKNADTYAMRQQLISLFERTFCDEVSTKEINRNMGASRA